MRFRLLALLAAAALAASLPADARVKAVSLASWLDGPVRYIIEPEEIREFKALDSDRERAQFIERFWRRRDPTPGTLANEYRQMFWERVREANQKFVETAKPGWKTDRGKIYILYGPPTEVHEDPTARTNVDATSGSGLIRWVYRGRAGGRRDIDPDVIVPFVADVSGEYHLSYDPQLASPFLNPFQLEDRNTAGLSSFLGKIESTSRDPLSVMLDLGKLQEVPPQAKILLEEVEATPIYATDPLPLEIDRFEDGTGKLVAVVTVALPGPEGSAPPTILARFKKPGRDGTERILDEGSFRVAGKAGARVAQGRVALAPGPWDVLVLAVDPASGSNRLYKGRVDPLPSAPLLLSDVVLARAMQPLPYAVQASYTDPYIVGGFRVTPRVTSDLVRGDALRLFFEIYGGTTPYRVSYQLEGREEDGRWRALGHPQERAANAHGQGYEIPTDERWPAGAYRMRIEVTDAAGRTVSAVRGFSLKAR